MTGPPPTTSELDAFREQADRFLAELMEEYYLHLAGHKDSLELEPIYERYVQLTTLEQAQAIGAVADGDRSLTELWRFACDGFMGNLTKQFEERSGELEATLEAEVDGEKIGYRMLRVAIANEPDRDRRRRLDEVRATLGDEHLNPIYIESVQVVNEAVRELGA